MRTKAHLIFLILAVVFVAGAAAADNTIVLNLDSNGRSQPQQQNQSGLELKHETLGATRQAISSTVHQPLVTDKTVSRHTKEATIGRVGVVTAPTADIRRRPGSSRTLFTCKKDTFLAVTGENDDSYGTLMADGSTGWIAKKNVQLLDYKVVGQVPQTTGIGSKVINTALQYLGIQYKWGGYSTSGIDCSGFVKAVFATHGIGLPRVARDQAQVGTAVSWKELQPGDRLYFCCKGKAIDHAGIYMGEGHFIHSSIGRGGVAVDDINREFWLRTLVAARRS